MRPYGSNAPVAAPHLAGMGGGLNNNIMASRGPLGGLGSVRPGTGLKRLHTPGGAAGPGPVGLNTKLDVDFRPVTQQGLTGKLAVQST